MHSPKEVHLARQEAYRKENAQKKAHQSALEFAHAIENNISPPSSVKNIETAAKKPWYIRLCDSLCCRSDASIHTK